MPGRVGSVRLRGEGAEVIPPSASRKCTLCSSSTASNRNIPISSSSVVTAHVPPGGPVATAELLRSVGLERGHEQ